MCVCVCVSTNWICIYATAIHKFKVIFSERENDGGEMVNCFNKKHKLSELEKKTVKLILLLNFLVFINQHY